MSLLWLSSVNSVFDQKQTLEPLKAQNEAAQKAQTEAAQISNVSGSAIACTDLHQFGDAFPGRAVYNAPGQLGAGYPTQTNTRPQISSLTT
ncbi:MAG: hypothetical protein IPM21_09690 [Acidobacteria bacterium]|nr:hypothetical protein [Acidobacteriota bacterium]